MTDDLSDYLIETRRKFHEFPELGFEEMETSKMIEEELSNLGITSKRVARTGLIAEIKGQKEGKTIAIRADIDGLPIEEQNNLEYKSKNKGTMHACGHDAHIAMALGVARKLVKNKIPFNGTIRFLFQPSEEKLPGGALDMIKEDALKGVDYIIGQHVESILPAGKVGIYPGIMMANADDFKIRIEGVGGHGSRPQEAVDALFVASLYVVQSQSIISRRISPVDPGVLTFGTFHSGYNFNIIAPWAELTGTVRTFDEETQGKIMAEMEKILEGLCRSTGCSYRFDYTKGYPALVNDPTVSRVYEDVVTDYLGKDAIVHPRPVMGGEDFAYYVKKVPGAYYFLGIRNEEKGVASPQHSPTYQIDETVLKHGSEILLRSALKLLS